MAGRLALLCLLEGIIVAFLAWQVFTGPSTPMIAKPAAGDKEPVSVPEPASRPIERPRPPADVPARKNVATQFCPDDPIGVLLTGSVRSRDGSPVAASITLARDRERRLASSAADGCYAVLKLMPGEWQATLRGKSILERCETVTLGNEAVQRRDFVCDRSFAVRAMIVTPDGLDATRALRLTLPGWDDFTIVGQRDPLPARLAATESRRIMAGEARWDPEMNPENGFAGTLFLAALPAHVALLQGHLVLQRTIVQPGQQEAKFTVDIEDLKRLAASAALRVLDEPTGTPLPEARVSMNISGRFSAGTKVGADGRAVLEGLRPGLLRCEVYSKDHETYTAAVRIEPGQRIDLGDIRIGAVSQLAGTVLMPDGSPAHASLQWTELKWRTRPTAFMHNRSTNTDTEGRFRLGSTGHGPIAVRANGKDGLIAAGVFDNPPATPIVLWLARPGLCTITRPPDPTRTFTVTFYDSRLRPIEAQAIEPRTTEVHVSLPYGDYTYTVHDEQDHLALTGSLRFSATPSRLEVR